MVEIGFAVTLVLALVAALFMAWAIGAVAIGGAAFSPAVGADAIPIRRAAFLLGFVGFFGAILQGGAVTETIGEGLVGGPQPSPVGAIVAVWLSAVLMAIGAFGRYPIPAAFTVTGAMVGAGLAVGGEPLWGTYGVFALLWVVAPFVVGLIAFGVTRLMYREDIPSTWRVGVIVAGLFFLVPLLEFAFLGPQGEQASLARAIVAWLPGVSGGVLWVALASSMIGGVVGYQAVVRHGARVARRELLVWLGILVAFSGAGNQVGLAVGPVVPLLDEVSLTVFPVLVMAAVGLVIGAWSGAPRLIEAVAREYATLSQERSIAALVPAFMVAQVGVLVGVPVSFNEIIIAAIIGSGLAAGGRREVSRAKIRWTVLAWVASLLVAFGVTFYLASWLHGAGFTGL